MPTYTIQAIAGQVREYDTQFGPMKSYTLKLEGEMDPIELSQKASTPAPEPNTTITGDITEGKYGKKFKKEYNAGGFGQASTAPVSSSSRTPSPYTRDDSHIKAQWAIGQAMTAVFDKAQANLEEVRLLANDLFAMVDRVKGGSESTNPKAQNTTSQSWKDEKSTTATSSGSTSDEVLNELFPDVEPVGETPWQPS